MCDKNESINTGENVPAADAGQNAPTNKPVNKSHRYYVELGKDVSYALRHAPHECGIVLDELGYTSIQELLNYLNSSGRHGTVELSDLIKMMEESDKKRHEINGDRIRAYYGHSTSEKIHKTVSKPPAVLYHGTSHEAAEIIMQEGLIPNGRQYVHLSCDVNTAQIVGIRKDKRPVILKINAQQANADGCKFHIGNEDIWLADSIPPKYIEIFIDPEK